MDAHVHHGLLLDGQLGDQILEVLGDSFADHLVFPGGAALGDVAQQVVLLRAPAHGHLLLPAEMVNARIVRNAHYPQGEELPSSCRPLQDVHHLDEDVLEVGGHVVVADEYSLVYTWSR